NGDVIGTATSGQGNGGNISINISDRISVDAVGNDVISNYKSSSVESHSVKIAGEINFNVRSLLDRKIASRIEYKTVSLNNRDRLVFVNYKDNLNNADQTISSNDNSIVASISGGNTVLLSKNGSSLSLKLNNSVSAIALHPNNKILASGCDDGTIYFWNVNTGKLIRSLKVHESKVNKVNYSPDGRRITSASDDGIVKVWYPDSSSSNPGFIIVIVSLISVFSGIIVLFVVTKRRQSKQHNNTSNTQTSYIITGWVVCVIPEDWRSDLEALRYELITAKNPTWYVRFITVTTLVDMLFGGIRVKLHNFYYGNNFMAVPGRPSITDKKDNSVNHND
uniref:WD40 repeat domain-containing protein n=1 Tax=Anabaena sp. CCY 9910 TaxID=3103870 RepID=UPI0039E0B7DB